MPLARWRGGSLSLYFFVAEALTNVAKYARATTATVALASDGGALVMTVSDDGVGGVDPHKGSGLRGLVDRLEAIGGRLEVSSARRRGTSCARSCPPACSAH